MKSLYDFQRAMVNLLFDRDAHWYRIQTLDDSAGFGIEDPPNLLLENSFSIVM
jgi:hypothetical protein